MNFIWGFYIKIICYISNWSIHKNDILMCYHYCLKIQSRTTPTQLIKKLLSATNSLIFSVQNILLVYNLTNSISGNLCKAVNILFCCAMLRIMRSIKFNFFFLLPSMKGSGQTSRFITTKYWVRFNHWYVPLQYTNSMSYTAVSYLHWWYCNCVIQITEYLLYIQQYYLLLSTLIPCQYRIQ